MLSPVSTRLSTLHCSCRSRRCSHSRCSRSLRRYSRRRPAGGRRRSRRHSTWGDVVMVSVIMTRSLYLLSAMIHTMMMRNRMNITPTAMPITATEDLQLWISRFFKPGES